MLPDFGSLSLFSANVEFKFEFSFRVSGAGLVEDEHGLVFQSTVHLDKKFLATVHTNLDQANIILGLIALIKSNVPGIHPRSDLPLEVRGLFKPGTQIHGTHETYRPLILIELNSVLIGNCEIPVGEIDSKEREIIEYLRSLQLIYRLPFNASGGAP